MKTTVHEAYHDLLPHIRVLDSKRAGLIDELGRSLLLRAEFPDAFEHGKCRAQISGHPTHRIVRGRPSPGLYFTVTRGDGSKRSKPLADMPEALWPVEMRTRKKPTTTGDQA